jgi:hypothetical protein
LKFLSRPTRIKAGICARSLDPNSDSRKLKARS